MRVAGPARIADLVRSVVSRVSGSTTEPATTLGAQLWEPDDDQRALVDALASNLRAPEIIDLVVFGSQARGGRTGFSDVDAILVVPDAVAGDRRGLRVLRRQVLAAQRVVLDHQPMQHHGFEVVTPGLLLDPSTLGMPAEALETTRSLYGHPTTCALPSVASNPGPFLQLVTTLLAVERWPRHPWTLHRVVSMFELAPALYLQATGRYAPKHLSFELARADLPGLWDPYDVLAKVRQRWLRRRKPALGVAARICRNPWLVVSLWRRVPTPTPQEITHLLTDPCLQELRRVLLAMSERVASIRGGSNEGQARHVYRPTAVGR
jgi:hypothetical protein